MKEALVRQTNIARYISSAVSTLVIVSLVGLLFGTPAVALATTVVFVYRALLFAAMVAGLFALTLIRFGTNVLTSFSADKFVEKDAHTDLGLLASNLEDSSQLYLSSWRAFNWITAAIIMTLAVLLNMWVLFVLEGLSEVMSLALYLESKRAAKLVRQKQIEVESIR